MPLPHFDYFQYMVKIKNFRGNVKTEGIGPDGGIFGGHWNSPDHSKYFHIDIPCASVGKMCVHTFEMKHRKNCECCPGHYLSTSVY